MESFIWSEYAQLEENEQKGTGNSIVKTTMLLQDLFYWTFRPEQRLFLQRLGGYRSLNQAFIKHQKQFFKACTHT